MSLCAPEENNGYTGTATALRSNANSLNFNIDAAVGYNSNCSDDIKQPLLINSN